MDLIRAPSEETPGEGVLNAVEDGHKSDLEIYRKIKDEPVLIGRLSCEHGQFLFRYNPDYMGEPISAFPDKAKLYRSEHLWPFFAVRIPPFDRQDMRETMASHSLDEDQIIEILGLIAKYSVSNPYEFKLS